MAKTGYFGPEPELARPNAIDRWLRALASGVILGAIADYRRGLRTSPTPPKGAAARNTWGRERAAKAEADRFFLSKERGWAERRAFWFACLGLNPPNELRATALLYREDGLLAEWLGDKELVVFERAS